MTATTNTRPSEAQMVRLCEMSHQLILVGGQVKQLFAINQHKLDIAFQNCRPASTSAQSAIQGCEQPSQFYLMRFLKPESRQFEFDSLESSIQMIENRTKKLLSVFNSNTHQLQLSAYPNYFKDFSDYDYFLILVKSCLDIAHEVRNIMLN